MDEYHITFGNVYIGKPGIKENDGKIKMMYPIEARWRNLTYSADIYVDVYQKLIKHQESVETRCLHEWKQVSVSIQVAYATLRPQVYFHPPREDAFAKFDHPVATRPP